VDMPLVSLEALSIPGDGVCSIFLLHFVFSATYTCLSMVLSVFVFLFLGRFWVFRCCAGAVMVLVCDDMLVLERRKEAQNKQSCGWRSLLSSPYHDLKQRLGAEPQDFLFCMLPRMEDGIISELRCLHFLCTVDVLQSFGRACAELVLR